MLGNWCEGLGASKAEEGSYSMVGNKNSRCAESKTCIQVLAPTFPNHVTLFWGQLLTSLCLSSQFSPLYNKDYNMHLTGLY